MAVSIVADFSLFIVSEVQKCIAFEVVTTKGIPSCLLCLLSESYFHVFVSVVSSCIVVTTHEDFLRFVLLSSDPMFATKMSAERRMSALVTGKFGIMFSLCT